MQERASWRSVIFLNLVRNVNEILDQLASELAAARRQPTFANSEESSEDSEPNSSRRRSNKPPLKFKEKHRLLSLRLGPLRGIQADLERRLGFEATELYTTDETTAAPFEASRPERRALQEFSINSSNGWKTALDKLRPMRRQDAGPMTRRQRDEDETTAEVIDSCREDIKAIWEDATITDMLNRRKSRRLEDAPGLLVLSLVNTTLSLTFRSSFLADADRIACRSYQPSDDDIIRYGRPLAFIFFLSFPFQCSTEDPRSARV